MWHSTEQLRCDVVVAGSGIGGLTAARTAIDHGASVVVIEKAAEIGGSAAMSGGQAWMAANLDVWLSVQPGANRAMGHALITNYLEGVDWFAQLGLRIAERRDPRPYKFARRVHNFLPDARSFMSALAESFESAGGTILTDTALSGIRLAPTGSVDGVTARRLGRTVEIAAQAVVLATGGFQASPDLRARYFGRWADRVIVRGNRYSTGDGFLAALKAGAGTAGPFGRFYGHMIPAPPAKTTIEKFSSIKPDFSDRAVFVNQHGERFDDEFLGDEVTVHSVVHQPDALCFLIFDERVCTGPTNDGPDVAARRVQNIREAGGEILESEDLEGLARLMSDRWSVPAHRLMGTLTEYNEAAAAGDASRLSIPRSGGLQALNTPPFYAIRFLPGATFTYGGARTNQRAQVLDSTDRPIHGLFAAGADVGGLYTRGYTGGLAIGIAYGRIAGHETQLV